MTSFSSCDRRIFFLKTEIMIHVRGTYYCHSINYRSLGVNPCSVKNYNNFHGLVACLRPYSCQDPGPIGNLSNDVDEGDAC